MCYGDAPGTCKVDCTTCSQEEGSTREGRHGRADLSVDFGIAEVPLRCCYYCSQLTPTVVAIVYGVHYMYLSDFAKFNLAPIWHDVTTNSTI